jgi:hypothetical protein
LSYSNYFWKYIGSCTPVNRQAKRGISISSQSTGKLSPYNTNPVARLNELLDEIKYQCLSEGKKQKIIQQEMETLIRAELRTKIRNENRLVDAVREETRKAMMAVGRQNISERASIYRNIKYLFINAENPKELAGVFREKYRMISREINIPDDFKGFYLYTKNKYSR